MGDVSARTYLHGLPGLLRRIADRLDPTGRPQAVGHSFTFEKGEGVRFRDDGRGCPLWYLGNDDYDRAHAEADKPTPKVNWEAMTVSYPGRTT